MSRYLYSTATLSAADGDIYRYSLGRGWDEGKEMVWIMLNPSTADAHRDDPTIRRCVSFAKREGFASIQVLNLFAYRSARPDDLLETAAAGIDVVGPRNHHEWTKVLGDSRTGMVVAAWGAHPSSTRLRTPVMGLLDDREVFCLGITAKGAPRHPLYVKRDTPFVLWTKR